MNKKYVCEECGCDLSKKGVQVDISFIAGLDEETGQFGYPLSNSDREIKCPECYAFVDVKMKDL